MDERPKLDTTISLKDFEDFYWLKGELQAFCRIEKLKTTGRKVEIAERIAHFLQTGLKELPTAKKTKKATSKFDWHTEKLYLHTEITDNYKNTANVRRFFLIQIGSHFKFNVKFMSWMKQNAGKTLAIAIQEWKKIATESKKNKNPKEIPPQFEYNTYLRDFMSDNPGQSREIAIKLWKIKRSRRGDNIYESEDLNLLANFDQLKMP